MERNSKAQDPDHPPPTRHLLPIRPVGDSGIPVAAVSFPPPSPGYPAALPLPDPRPPQPAGPPAPIAVPGDPAPARSQRPREWPDPARPPPPLGFGSVRDVSCGVPGWSCHRRLPRGCIPCPPVPYLSEPGGWHGRLASRSGLDQPPSRGLGKKVFFPSFCCYFILSQSIRDWKGHRKTI